MKKLLYLVPAFALTLGACSNDIPTQEDGGFYDGQLETNYLAVDIANTGNITRASDGTSDDYEDGINNENDVKSVRFYFFDAFNKAARVVNATGTLTGYLDWEDNQETPENEGPSTSDPTADQKPNIEKIVSTKLIIQTPQGDRIPESVVAVINPTADLKGQNFADLDALNAYTANHTASTTGTFVMSNTVYNDEGLKETVNVKDYIKTTPELATDNPVTIYVERVNAKVRLLIAEALKGNANNKTLSDGTVLYNTGVENTSGATNSKIYVKLLGWEVISTPKKSFLMKSIEPTWTNTGLFASDIYNWSSASYHRSFWAINPELNYQDGEDEYKASDNDYFYTDFAGIQNVKGFENGVPTKLNYTYVQENAGVSATSPATAHPTQVIIAGMLVNENGDAVEIAEWATNHYTKADLLKNLANYVGIYKITTTEKADGEKEYAYDKLDDSYFKFVSAEAAGKSSYSEDGRFETYIQLDLTKVAGLQLTTSVGGEAIEAATINASLLNNVLPAKIWTSGMTYYYFNIEHLGDKDAEGNLSPAYYGVVRNHIYDMTITALSGLGTPVFEGNRVIIPEKPEKDVAYIAAKINVIPWRIVKKNIELSW